MSTAQGELRNSGRPKRSSVGLGSGLAKGPGSGALDRTISDVPLKTVYEPQDVAGLDLAGSLAGRVSVYARHSSQRLSRPALDDAAVRRFRQRRANQRALSLSARARAARAFGCVRYADADGLRLRRTASARRSRQVRRRDRLARRHGGALRRHRHGRHHDLDDDQRPGLHRARAIHRGRREEGHSRARSSAERFRPTSSKSTSRRKSGSFRRARTCASSST